MGSVLYAVLKGSPAGQPYPTVDGLFSYAERLEKLQRARSHAQCFAKIRTLRASLDEQVIHALELEFTSQQQSNRACADHENIS